jgi:phosphoribosylformylglycinamidine cyclo-ligase
MLKYDLRGVSASKSEVHAAIKNLDKGLFPTAFCKIMPDVVGKNENYCNIMHADTAGTKTSLAYLYWRETGDLSVWRGIAQDSIVMNLDDMACVGCVKDIVLSSTIGRNKNQISGEVIQTLIEAGVDFFEKMRGFGINLHLAGGETADVGDIVRTIDVGYTAFARMKRKDLVINNVQAGDVIVGLASFGQATYEDSYNSGIGSNGLTSARHDVLSKYYYSHFPESFDIKIPEDVAYSGNRRLIDSVQLQGEEYIVGKLLLSPTRTYLPFLQLILPKYKKHLHGIIHNTGGAQTKAAKFVKDKHIIKDNLFDTPPVFQLIQQESNTAWREMYQVFNMGHRLELYVAPKYANALIESAQSLGIAAQVIGHVEAGTGEKVTVKSKYGTFAY